MTMIRKPLKQEVLMTKAMTMKINITMRNMKNNMIKSGNSKTN